MEKIKFAQQGLITLIMRLTLILCLIHLNLTITLFLHYYKLPIDLLGGNDHIFNSAIHCMYATAGCGLISFILWDQLSSNETIWLIRDMKSATKKLETLNAIKDKKENEV